VLSRFLITHCVADASIIGFLSEFSEAPLLDNDTWIEAEGVLDVTTYNGTELPLIKITNWKKVKEPETPYLYPISIKIL
jgi:putative membrane protein